MTGKLINSVAYSEPCFIKIWFFRLFH